MIAPILFKTPDGETVIDVFDIRRISSEGGDVFVYHQELRSERSDPFRVVGETVQGILERMQKAKDVVLPDEDYDDDGYDYEDDNTWP